MALSSEIDANNYRAYICSAVVLARNARGPFAAFPDSYSRPTIEQPRNGSVDVAFPPGISPCPPPARFPRAYLMPPRWYTLYSLFTR